MCIYNIYIYIYIHADEISLADPGCYGSIPVQSQCLMVIERNGGLSNFGYSCGLACQ